jgi:hypothetical protein
MLNLFPLIIMCIFGLLVSAMVIGFFLMIIGSMAGVPLSMKRKSQPILELNPEDFFDKIIPKLLKWNTNAFNDLSSLMDCQRGTDFTQTRVYGTLKSLHDPDAKGWIAFDLSMAWGKDARLRLRTSEHDLEFSINIHHLLDIQAEFSDHQLLVGRLQKKSKLTTIFDKDGREIGTYQFPFRSIFFWKTAYGDITLRGQNIGRLNHNLLPVFGNWWEVRPSSLGPAFQLKSFTISDDDQIWLLALCGLEICSCVLKPRHSGA